MKNTKHSTKGHRTLKGRLASKFLHRNVRVLKNSGKSRHLICAGKVKDIPRDGVITIDDTYYEIDTMVVEVVPD